MMSCYLRMNKQYVTSGPSHEPIRACMSDVESETCRATFDDLEFGDGFDVSFVTLTQGLSFPIRSDCPSKVMAASARCS